MAEQKRKTTTVIPGPLEILGYGGGMLAAGYIGKTLWQQGSAAARDIKNINKTVADLNKKPMPMKAPMQEVEQLASFGFDIKSGLTRRDPLVKTFASFKAGTPIDAANLTAKLGQFHLGGDTDQVARELQSLLDTILSSGKNATLYTHTIDHGTSPAVRLALQIAGEKKQIHLGWQNTSGTDLYAVPNLRAEGEYAMLPHMYDETFIHSPSRNEILHPMSARIRGVNKAIQHPDTHNALKSLDAQFAARLSYIDPRDTMNALKVHSAAAPLIFDASSGEFRALNAVSDKEAVNAMYNLMSASGDMPLNEMISHRSSKQISQGVFNAYNPGVAMNNGPLLGKAQVQSVWNQGYAEGNGVLESLSKSSKVNFAGKNLSSQVSLPIIMDTGELYSQLKQINPNLRGTNIIDNFLLAQGRQPIQDTAVAVSGNMFNQGYFAKGSVHLPLEGMNKSRGTARLLSRITSTYVLANQDTYSQQVWFDAIKQAENLSGLKRMHAFDKMLENPDFVSSSNDIINNLISGPGFGEFFDNIRDMPMDQQIRLDDLNLLGINKTGPKRPVKNKSRRTKVYLNNVAREYGTKEDIGGLRLRTMKQDPTHKKMHGIFKAIAGQTSSPKVGAAYFKRLHAITGTTNYLSRDLNLAAEYLGRAQELFSIKNTKRFVSEFNKLSKEYNAPTYGQHQAQYMAITNVADPAEYNRMLQHGVIFDTSGVRKNSPSLLADSLNILGKKLNMRLQEGQDLHEFGMSLINATPPSERNAMRSAVFSLLPTKHGSKVGGATVGTISPKAPLSGGFNARRSVNFSRDFISRAQLQGLPELAEYLRSNSRMLKTNEYSTMAGLFRTSIEEGFEAGDVLLNLKSISSNDIPGLTAPTVKERIDAINNIITRNGSDTLVSEKTRIFIDLNEEIAVQAGSSTKVKYLPYNLQDIKGYTGVSEDVVSGVRKGKHINTMLARDLDLLVRASNHKVTHHTVESAAQGYMDDYVNILFDGKLWETSAIDGAMLPLNQSIITDEYIAQLRESASKNNKLTEFDSIIESMNAAGISDDTMSMSLSENSFKKFSKTSPLAQAEGFHDNPFSSIAVYGGRYPENSVPSIVYNGDRVLEELHRAAGVENPVRLPDDQLWGSTIRRNIGADDLDEDAFALASAQTPSMDAEMRQAAKNMRENALYNLTDMRKGGIKQETLSGTSWDELGKTIMKMSSPEYAAKQIEESIAFQSTVGDVSNRLSVAKGPGKMGFVGREVTMGGRVLRNDSGTNMTHLLSFMREMTIQSKGSTASSIESSEEAIRLFDKNAWTNQDERLEAFLRISDEGSNRMTYAPDDVSFFTKQKDGSFLAATADEVKTKQASHMRIGSNPDYIPNNIFRYLHPKEDYRTLLNIIDEVPDITRLFQKQHVDVSAAINAVRETPSNTKNATIPQQIAQDILSGQNKMRKTITAAQDVSEGTLKKFFKSKEAKVIGGIALGVALLRPLTHSSKHQDVREESKNARKPLAVAGAIDPPTVGDVFHAPQQGYNIKLRGTMPSSMNIQQVQNHMGIMGIPFGGSILHRDKGIDGKYVEEIQKDNNANLWNK